MTTHKKSLTAWLNLRTVVFLLALFLILAPTKPEILKALDRGLFSLGMQLIVPQTPTVDVSIVALNENEYSNLKNNWGQANQLGQFLKKLSSNGKSTVGVVFDSPQAQSQVDPSVFELLDQLRQEENISANVKQQLNSHLNSQNAIKNSLQSERVLSGIDSQYYISTDSEMIANSNKIVTNETTASDLYSWLPETLSPNPTDLKAAQTSHNGTTANTDSEYLVKLFPISNEDELPTPLLFRNGDNLESALVLAMLANKSDASEITWFKNQALQLNSVRYPTSADGSVIPYYVQKPESIGFIKQTNLSEANRSLPQQSYVLLGSENSSLLHSAALTLLSIENLHYFYSPFWTQALQVALVILVLLYLLWLQPKIGHVASAFATSLLLFAFVVAQLGWQITQWQYLPLGIVLQFLLLGHLLMVLWKLQRDYLSQLQASAHGARYQLGLQLFRDGRADDSLLAIKECFSSDAVLNLIYDIASQQERKRQYGEAIKTYKHLMERRPGFRDVKEKVEKLIAFSSSTGTGSFGTDTTISKTLIISESSISKPVLGRYEIERELGRGAMGVVYLGRDPKISRMVAIKTLSYNNIAEKELNEFKERFFREAEAAGRLNHPNIVTIYDVGEEHDLAFIAMDYIEGKSLGDFTEKDNLLAVEQVFKIIIVVADALFYAHDKQVVHRDIKPSNIMYSPVNGAIKVTDFGVARLVDSSRTQTGDILGSPLYMSPEQLKGAKVTEQTDIYSLGVTFYQLLTGQLPHTGDSLANLTYNIIHNKHTGVREFRPELPKSITRVINKAMHKEPAKRYSDASEFAEAVRKVSRELEAY